MKESQMTVEGKPKTGALSACENTCQATTDGYCEGRKEGLLGRLDGDGLRIA